MSQIVVLCWIAAVVVLSVYAFLDQGKIKRLRRQRDVLKDHIPDFLCNHDHDDLLLVLKEISEE